jgi:hypothetical protein
VVGEKRYWFEDVPEEGRYWTVAQVGVPQSRAVREPPDLEDASEFSEEAEEVEEFMRRGFEIGFVPAAFELQLIQTNPAEYALILYTSRQAAEEELRAWEERDAEEYLRLVDEYGQEQTDKAYSNTPPYEVVWTTPTLLLEKLEELENAGLLGYGPSFESVQVDGRDRDRWSFKRELRRRVREEESGDE